MPQTLNVSAWASWVTAQAQREVMEGAGLTALKAALQTEAALSEVLLAEAQTPLPEEAPPPTVDLLA